MAHEPRPRRYLPEASNPPAAIPDEQRQALERRNALSEQQRTFRIYNPVPEPHFPRRRPPG